jgi:hypothetical protein
MYQLVKYEMLSHILLGCLYVNRGWHHTLVILVLLGTWKDRNNIIYKRKVPSIETILTRVRIEKGSVVQCMPLAE